MTALQQLVTNFPQELNASKFTQCLAFLALQERRADVLKLCLDGGGFGYTAYFYREAETVKKGIDPEIWTILEESSYRRLNPRPLKRGTARGKQTPGMDNRRGNGRPMLARDRDDGRDSYDNDDDGSDGEDEEEEE